MYYSWHNDAYQPSCVCNGVPFVMSVSPWEVMSQIRQGNAPSIKKGHDEPAVKFIQYIFELPVDGKFGLKTEKAVKDFQQVHRLIPDGVVGPSTWEAIRRAYLGC